MVLMRLPALQSPPKTGGESFAVLACSTSPPQRLSTPVNQLNFSTSTALASAQRALVTRAKSAAPPALRPKGSQKTIFELVCCTMTYEVY
jgi:hypothetical protein